MSIYYVSFGVCALIVFWALGSYLVVRTLEKPAYVVLEQRDGYEIREYAAYTVAETTVGGPRSTAMRSGFRLIADYIFGNNTSKTSIAMTAPVLEQPASEKISMTTPVLSSSDDTSERTIAFVLPSTYTLDTLPTPNNPAVTLREVPAHKVAALTFTWYVTANRIAAKEAALLSFLNRDHVVVTGGPQVAQYNPPLSMPLVLRNEILIPIDYSTK